MAMQSLPNPLTGPLWPPTRKLSESCGGWDSCLCPSSRLFLSGDSFRIRSALFTLVENRNNVAAQRSQPSHITIIRFVHVSKQASWNQWDRVENMGSEVFYLSRGAYHMGSVNFGDNYAVDLDDHPCFNRSLHACHLALNQYLGCAFSLINPPIFADSG